MFCTLSVLRTIAPGWWLSDPLMNVMMGTALLVSFTSAGRTLVQLLYSRHSRMSRP